MGCFDSNCCLTGLALQENDPIRMGLVARPKYGLHPETPCYVGSHFQFLIPPVKGVYNDYGNSNWSDLEPKWALEYILRLLKPKLQNFKTYSKSVRLTQIKDMEKIWNAVVQQDVYCTELVSDGDHSNIFPWMCHAWAFDEVLKMWPLSPELEPQCDNMCLTPLEEPPVYNTETKEGLKEWRAYCNAPRDRVIGDAGGIHQELFLLIHESEKEAHEGFPEHKAEFRQLIAEAVQLCQNMRLIRKHLFPLAIVGQQHEQYEQLLPWTKLVWRKARESLEARREIIHCKGCNKEVCDRRFDDECPPLAVWNDELSEYLCEECNQCPKS